MSSYTTIFDKATGITTCFVNDVEVSYEDFMEAQRKEGRDRAEAQTLYNRLTLRAYPINTAVAVVDPEGLTETWFGIVVGYGMSQANKITLKVDKIGVNWRPIELAPECVEKV